MLKKKNLQNLKYVIEACKLEFSASGMLPADIERKIEALEAQIEAGADELLKYEGMLRGARIAQLGTELAAQAGRDVKPGLFEMYEGAKEKDKLLVEAGLLYNLWETSSSESELRLKLSDSPLRTFTFGLAAIRVADHFADVQARFAAELNEGG